MGSPGLSPEVDPDSIAAPTAVVFDIGEVLIDETRIYSVWAEILGVSALTLDAVLGAAITQGESEWSALAHVAPNMDAPTLLHKHEEALGGLQPQDVYPDAVGCLADVRAAGFKVAIAGNQPSLRRAQLQALGLVTDVMVLSEEIGVDKPAQEFFDFLLGRLAEEPGRVLYVGDRVDNDILPAIEAGMRTCWLQRGPWGQLQELPQATQVDLVLEGLGELVTLLTAWRDEHREEASA